MHAVMLHHHMHEARAEMRAREVAVKWKNGDEADLLRAPTDNQ
jgi:hypothetical protein